MINLHETFGDEAIEYCQRYMEEYEYADNLRMCYRGDNVTVQDYEERMNTGCCGFVDYITIPFLVNGKDALFGFNYGH